MGNDLKKSEELDRKYKVHREEAIVAGKYRPIVVEGDIEAYFAEKGNLDSKQLLGMINRHIK